MALNKNKELPKWFNGEVYKQGGTAFNIFTTEPYELNANELSMYDFIMGCVMTFEYGVNVNLKIMNHYHKAIDWFRKANPEAYMVLLD
jgi:hypothetical protein|tara:strand:- start:40 stop:303 length:264 start_codon:yes stop_codon:yes gene_type:complete